MEKSIVTKTFVVTAEHSVMERFERFLALLHFNSSFGHSAVFGMFLDGDGSDKIKIVGVPKHLSYQVEAIGNVGYDVELVTDKGYGGLHCDKSRTAKHYVRPAAILFREGEIRKTIPSKDWDWERQEQQQKLAANGNAPQQKEDCKP